MTNHVNGKSPQGLENHDSIVSSYKELIREQVNILALFLSSKQPRDSVDSPRKSVTLTSSGDFQFRPELKCRWVFFLFLLLYPWPFSHLDWVIWSPTYQLLISGQALQKIMSANLPYFLMKSRTNAIYGVSVTNTAVHSNVSFLHFRMKKSANLNQDTVIWNPLIIRWNKRLLTSTFKILYWSSSELPRVCPSSWSCC